MKKINASTDMSFPTEIGDINIKVIYNWNSEIPATDVDPYEPAKVDIISIELWGINVTSEIPEDLFDMVETNILEEEE